MATGSSGIASTLASVRITLHSTINFSLNVINMNRPAGNITRLSEKSRIIENACALFIDETSCLHNKCIEAVDFTLRDILSENDGNKNKWEENNAYLAVTLGKYYHRRQWIQDTIHCIVYKQH